jgi:hypothetical protein
MSVLFPAGREQFTPDMISFNIHQDGYIDEKAGTYYFSIQGCNRIGKNIPYILGPLTLPANSRLELIVSNLKWAEEWLYICIGVSTTNNPASFTQILKIPGKFAGIYGTVLSENFKSAIPPRDFENYIYNYYFIAPYVQHTDAWEQVELKLAGKNISTSDNFGLSDTWSVSGNILFDLQLTTFHTIADSNEFPTIRESFFNQFTGGYEISPYGIELNGHLVQAIDTGYIYELNIFDSNSHIDNINVFATDDINGNGRWKRINTWDINVENVSSSKGSHQNLARSGNPNLDNQLIVPNFYLNQDSTTEMPPIILWLANTQETAIKKYNKVQTQIYIGEQIATNLFIGKVAVTLLGYVSLSTYEVRIRDADNKLFGNLNKRFYVYDYNAPLQLPDTLLANEAVILRYEMLFEPEEFHYLVGIDTYIKVMPGFIRSTSVPIPFGSIFSAGLIFGDDGHGYGCKIVPGNNNTAVSLPGSGIVQGVAFPFRESQSIANLPSNTANIAIYITSEGYCFARDYNNPPPQSVGVGLRATVSTSSGKGDIEGFRGIESNNSQEFLLESPGGIKIKILHRALYEDKLLQRTGQIRGDLPDPIAGFPCQFNCTNMDIIIRHDRFSDIEDTSTYLDSTYYEFTNIPISFINTIQTISFSNSALAADNWTATNTLLPSKYGLYFGIYAPPQAIISEDVISGNFPVGRYRIACRYNYDGNYISRIDHDVSSGHLPEVFNSLNTLLSNNQKDLFWDEPVNNIDNLENYPINRLWEGKVILCKAYNTLYRFTYYLTDEIPDYYNCIAHALIASGAWIRIGDSGNALKPTDCVLPEGGNLLFAPYGIGVKFYSGKYIINNEQSPLLPEVFKTEFDLKNMGLLSPLNQTYWVIRNYTSIAIDTIKNVVVNYPKGIILGRFSGNLSGQHIYYFSDQTTTLALDPFSKLQLSLNYGNICSFISQRYVEPQLRGVAGNLNVDDLVIVLEELTPQYVFYDNLIKWTFNQFVANLDEYYAWLALNNILAQLATTLNLEETDFSFFKDSTDLPTNLTKIYAALDDLNDSGYPASVADYWLDYVAIINYVLVSYDLFDAALATSTINEQQLYKFVTTHPMTRVNGVTVNLETIVYGAEGLTVGNEVISSTFDISKTTRNNSGWCEYLFEVPSPVDSIQKIDIPEADWGTYTKAPQFWEYGDHNPSGIFPNTYRIYLGFRYKQDSDRIVSISLNPLLDHSFPRLSPGINQDWSQVISSFNQVFSHNDSSQSLTLSQNGNTIELKVTDDGADIIINGVSLLNPE